MSRRRYDITMEEYKRKAADIINNYVQEHGNGVVLETKEIRNLLSRNGLDGFRSGFLPSDYCYNRVNIGTVNGFEDEIHLFEYIEYAHLRLIGDNAKYTGDVIWAGHEDVGMVGHWENGNLSEWYPERVAE